MRPAAHGAGKPCEAKFIHVDNCTCISKLPKHRITYSCRPRPSTMAMTSHSSRGRLLLVCWSRQV